jgi:phosphatidate cytidylyltransferase
MQDLFDDDLLGSEPTPKRPPRPPRKPRRKRGASGETAKRILFAIPAIVFAIAITVAGGLVFAIAMIGVGVVCLREYLAMTQATRPISRAAYLSVAALILAAYFGTAFNVLLVLAASFPVLFLFGAGHEHRDGITVSMGVTLLGIVWIGIPLVHAVLLRDLPHHGAALCGFLIGTMAFWFAGLYQDWLSGADALIIGAAVAAIAPVGDLFESMLKRDLGTKDTGTLFGPHGGILDRLDAVFFTVVVAYYLAVQLVY